MEYFIFQWPEIPEGMFTYPTSLLVFLLYALMLSASVIMIFRGRQAMTALCSIVLGSYLEIEAVSRIGALGYSVNLRILILAATTCVLFALVYFIINILGKIPVKLGIKGMPWVSSVLCSALGSAITIQIIWLKIFRWPTNVCLIIMAALFVLGVIFQRK
ncbi:MAG: hypothetical protein K6E33_02110 [Lachnospiraceae bacterium]|nr:hypothetical protein [Lachnospiraceae bacterium]